MKYSFKDFLLLTVLLFVSPELSWGIITICSWNLKDLGVSKSDTEIHYIAGILKDYDVCAIQEVVAGPGGAQAVTRVAETMNRMGTSWDYAISDPTSSSAYKTERYAFIWKKNKVNLLSKPWLEKKYAQEFDREPYFATFKADGKTFTLVNFHAITKSLQPETEVKYFKFLPAEYPALNLVFIGDFNLPESHSVFNPLKSMGYTPVFKGQKTTLRDRCLPDGCLASEYDNIFIKTGNIKVVNKGVVHFYKDYSDLDKAKRISDHVPVWCMI